MILERKEWKEFHENGQVWITGEIGIVADSWKHLYDFRTGFEGYEGQAVVRLGRWTKQYDNGQLAWTLEYDEYGRHINRKFPQFRSDGVSIDY